jgi:1-deoxy-D-xylulose-5-phosphate reductoisomerase
MSAEPATGSVETITVLGATGSIGVSALDVLARHPERFRVHGLSGHRNIELLAEQIRRLRPARVVVAADAVDRLLGLLGRDAAGTSIESGPDALVDLAADGGSVTVVAGIVGAAGLAPTLAAVRRGKRVLLANKEALVMAGSLFMDAVAESGACLLPLDSEHNAVFQCLPAGYRPGDAAAAGVRRVLLTASGGPFRETPLAALREVGPEQACAHPNWSMGRKISVDSATLMNKGLERIEACWLFGLPSRCVEVVVHPQSVVHSLVEYQDGSMLAQLGSPDMRIPIAHALGYPLRIVSGAKPLDLVRIGRLDFEPPDTARFPCLDVARRAFDAGGDACATLNAANEVAVDAFLGGQVGFMDIPGIVSSVMERRPGAAVNSLDDVLAADAQARRLARQVVAEFRAGGAG